MKQHFPDLVRHLRAALYVSLLTMLGTPELLAVTLEDAEAALLRGDYTSALPIYSSLAEAGDTTAMVRLAGLYQKGEGVTRDLARAINYYTQAAARGNADAQYNLGNLYLLGEGVTQDDDWAFTYYRQAAEQGHIRAQKNVNEFYRAAGVPPPIAIVAPALLPIPHAPAVATNPASTTEIPVSEIPISDDELRAMEIARAHGIRIDHAPVTQNVAVPTAALPRAAASRLNDIKQHLAGGETALAKSELEILADEGNLEAQFLLSRLLVTLSSDAPGEALLWLKRAASGGFAEAQYALAEIYRRGNDVPPDEAEAITWYRAAARQGHAGARQQLEASYRGAGIPVPDTSVRHEE